MASHGADEYQAAFGRTELWKHGLGQGFRAQIVDIKEPLVIGHIAQLYGHIGGYYSSIAQHAHNWKMLRYVSNCTRQWQSVSVQRRLPFKLRMSKKSTS